MTTESQSEEIQQAKEEARLAALKLGFALERHNDTIESINVQGTREILVANQPADQIWQTARDILNKQIKSETEEDKTKAYPKCARIVAYADGGSRGNPGPSASGFTLNDESNDSLLEEGGEYLGVTTNNQAEYHALKMVLEHSLKYRPDHLLVHMDSLLVVNQLNGIYKIKNRDLWPVYQNIKRLATQIDEVVFVHVPREQNKVADAVVNKILDDHANSLKQ